VGTCGVRLVDRGGLRWDDGPFGREILLQADAALSEAQLGLLVVDVRDGVMTLTIPLARAAEALSAVGFREAPIARTTEGPRTVVDRPKGVPPMSACT